MLARPMLCITGYHNLSKGIMMKKLVLASTLSAVLTAPAIVCAQGAPAAAPASPHTFTGNIGLFSDYRFRGISQTYRQPAIQGGFDYSHVSGVYAGTWASNVSGNLYANGAGMEWDMYGGYKFEPIKDLTMDVGVLYYYYPGAAFYNATLGKSGNKYDNTELYVAGTYGWFTAKYSYAVSDYFGTKTATFGGTCGITSSGVAATSGCIGANPGNSKGSSYLDLAANFEVFDKTTLGLHVGHTTVKNYNQLSYTDYKLSLSRDFGWATLGAAYITTDAKQQYYRYGPAGLVAGTSTENKDPSRGALVLSISKTF